MDYSKTLNLPKTDFPMKADLPKKEPEILKFWEQQKIYEKLQNKTKGLPKFVLHDGPPYPNGDVHLGTAFNKFLKDVIVKYKSASGYDSPYVPGWDCHGMPIEHIVIDNLGDEVKKISKIEIRKRCREYALKYLNIQREQFKRLGVRGDWENPYLTLSPEYESKIIETFGKLVEGGYIYKALRPIYWCYHCQTALAEAEIEYEEHKSPSIYVKFKVIDSEKLGINNKVYFVIWTTTPWTLPANVAIALHPDSEYCAVQIKNEEIFIIAKDLIDFTMNKFGIQEYEILKTFLGRETEGIKTQHPFVERESIIIIADYVAKGTGTGCVHIAPGHGQEDYISALKYKLPVIAPIDNNGNFTKEAGEFSGLNVFDANSKIIERLKNIGFLIFDEEITHSYPNCWRCHNPIIFRATEQWFFDMDKNNLREKVLNMVEKIRWIPAWGGEKFYNLIKHRPDWCISRQRSWGVPIPVFYCEDCNEVLINKEIIEYIKKIVEKQGVDFWFEKTAKEILPEDIKCKCGKSNFRKEMDILDVWFESGVSWAGVLKTKKNLIFPSDIYLEATDQHRGWFQSSIWPSVAIEGTPPYRIVITHGLIQDEEGKKMSKSKGNVISPDEIIEKYGADILRLWFSSVDYTSDVRLSSKILEPIVDAYRKIRNTIRFLLGNLHNFNKEKDSLSYNELFEIDKWTLHKLQEVVEKVKNGYENYEFHTVFHTIHNFCIIDLSSFYLDILKDCLYTFSPSSKRRRSAQTTLYEILTTLTKLIFPILSFTSEEIWKYLQEKEESVQLANFPEVNPEYLDYQIKERYDKILEIRDEVNKAMEIARRKNIIKSTLEAKIEISGENEYYEFLRSFSIDELKTIFIVSDVELIDEIRDEDMYESDKILNIKILIKKAQGKKCIRCWNYSETTDKNPEYKNICLRCISALKNEQ